MFIQWTEFFGKLLQHILYVVRTIERANVK